MKKLFTPLMCYFIAIAAIINFSCSSTKVGKYVLTEQDAALAVRQLLEIGAKDGAVFTKEGMMDALFPEQVKKTLNTLQQLGLTSEIDRFTTTLATASEKTAQRSIPVFVNAITSMKLSDAMSIVKKGGTAATQYLRTNAGTQLREAIKPVVKEALDEYKLIEQWNKIIKPAQTLAGSKLNLDLETLMAGVVSEAMFQKMEENEKKIRTETAARTTPLLQKVFSKDWN